MGKLVPFIGPAFLIAVGFMDPGNWATLIEGGSRFGYELLWVVVLANIIGILLQTLSARLGVITGKHLAQICREEYPRAICISLWVFCEISIITLDLTMVLGTAIGLNVVLRMPILPSLFLMLVDSVLFIIILPLMEVRKTEVVTVFVVGMVLVCFLLDSVITSPPPMSMFVGMLPKLRHETLYTAISLLGANVMPHNFYLHSALVQADSKASDSVDTSCHYHLWDTVSSFSAVLVVNMTVLVVAVTTFHNAGLVVLTLQDAQALIEQVLNNSVAPAAFGVALLVAGQLSTLTGSTAGQMVSEEFLGYKVGPWLHRLTVRGIALVPAALCVWRYGNEGTYQMLVFSQVVLALQLPFTLAPLIKITCSERIMGPHKNSWFLETLAWLSLTVICAVNVWLILDMVFGETEDGSAFAVEYLGGFEWVQGMWGESLQAVLFFTVCAVLTVSLGFLVWMIFSPLKMDAQYPGSSMWYEAYERRKEAEYRQLAVVTPSDIYEDSTSILDAIFPRKDHKEYEDYKQYEEPEQELKEQTEQKEPVEPIVVGTPAVVSSQYEEEVIDGKNKTVVADAEAVIVTTPKEAEATATEEEVAGLPTPEEAVTAASAKEVEMVETTKKPVQDESTEPPEAEINPLEVSLDSGDDKAMMDLPSSPDNSSAAGSLVAPSPSKSDTKEMDVATSFSIVKVPTEDSREADALNQAEAEADADTEILGKEEEEMDAWENLEQEDVLVEPLVSNVNSSANALPYDGPASGRSVRSDTSEGCGSGSGSLSRLSGLGRAARRQFALILEEFWANLYDYHGQPIVAKTQPALPAPKSSYVELSSRGRSLSIDGGKSLANQKWSWQTPSSVTSQNGGMDAYIRAQTHAAASTSSPLAQSWSEHGLSSSFDLERRYSSMRISSHHEDYDAQPATIHGYRPSFSGRSGATIPGPKARSLHMDVNQFGTRNSTGEGHREEAEMTLLREGRQNSFDSEPQPLLSSHWSSITTTARTAIDTKGSDRLLTQTEKHLGPAETSSYDSSQWDPLVFKAAAGRWNPLVYRATGELDMGIPRNMNLGRTSSFGHSPIGRGGDVDHAERAPLVFDELSPSQSHRDAFSIQTSAARAENNSLWSRQPFEQLFGSTDAPGSTAQLPARKGSGRLVPVPSSGTPLPDTVDPEVHVLENLRTCIGKLLRLEGSDWLFRPDSGADEDLIAAVAIFQRTTSEAEKQEPYKFFAAMEPQPWDNHSRSYKGPSDYLSSKLHCSVPNCGEACVWNGALIISFGVWCVHRVLELSLMESRPELWGKYTFVLNRLQGILEPAFSKPRFVPPLCRCMNDPVLFESMKRRTSLSRQGSLRDYGSGDFSSAIPGYQNPWPWGRSASNTKGKGASASVFLERIKEVEAAVGSRKGRTGTAAGDIAFPKGKENLASVLKRYKRRLSSKPPGGTGGNGGGGGRRRGGPTGFPPTLFFAALVCASFCVLLPSID
ncbi:hypothetical protein R1sor_002853 [Riccia sorocarpa]|uniref:Natural resistance-associated macrophage protein n=1 Tax=Riccia sorocarpa TaxID=122646 RepID=A0ABD3H1M4_9MARC